MKDSQENRKTYEPVSQDERRKNKQKKKYIEALIARYPDYKDIIMSAGENYGEKE